MSQNTQQMSFVSGMKAFFGLKPGQTTLDFGKELKELSHEDKTYFAQRLRDNGMNIADPVPVAA